MTVRLFLLMQTTLTYDVLYLFEIFAHTAYRMCHQNNEDKYLEKHRFMSFNTPAAVRPMGNSIVATTKGPINCV